MDRDEPHHIDDPDDLDQGTPGALGEDVERPGDEDLFRDDEGADEIEGEGD